MKRILFGLVLSFAMLFTANAQTPVDNFKNDAQVYVTSLNVMVKTDTTNVKATIEARIQLHKSIDVIKSYSNWKERINEMSFSPGACVACYLIDSQCSHSVYDPCCCACCNALHKCLKDNCTPASNDIIKLTPVKK